MDPTRCPQCGEPFEPGYALCWRCGTHADGRPADADFVPEAAAPVATVERTLDCLRCGRSMARIRSMTFHEGRRWGFWLGDLGEALVNGERFDVYACRGCGKVEFFLDGGAEVP